MDPFVPFVGKESCHHIWSILSSSGPNIAIHLDFRLGAAETTAVLPIAKSSFEVAIVPDLHRRHYEDENEEIYRNNYSGINTKSTDRSDI